MPVRVRLSALFPALRLWLPSDAKSARLRSLLYSIRSRNSLARRKAQRSGRDALRTTSASSNCDCRAITTAKCIQLVQKAVRREREESRHERVLHREAIRAAFVFRA